MGALLSLLQENKNNPIIWVIITIISICTYLGIIFAGIFFSIMACLIYMAAGGFDKKEKRGILVCTLYEDVHYSQIFKKDNKYYLEQGSYLGEKYQEIYQPYHEIKFSDALERITDAYEWYNEAGYSGPKDNLDEVIDRLND